MSLRTIERNGGAVDLIDQTLLPQAASDRDRPDTQAVNPAFDVTPLDLITAPRSGEWSDSIWETIDGTR